MTTSPTVQCGDYNQLDGVTSSTTVLSLYLKSSCQIKCWGIFEDPLNTFILGHHAQQVFLPLMHSLTCEREKVPQAHISSYGYVKTPLHPTQVICPFDCHLPHGEKTPVNIRYRLLGGLPALTYRSCREAQPTGCLQRPFSPQPESQVLETQSCTHQEAHANHRQTISNAPQ